ncbi:hypothetical protein BGW38_003119 [Lunasporangiospora selenospora]|uniref:Protein BIG1 n=1 Tax=Lunasporangiospora selenospora TaxID=979761 RepID=A0A9P6G115_9FUNG|nr:hypothetical protein BGW38_003119 [Lunasporangiospora selenospora]
MRATLLLSIFVASLCKVSAIEDTCPFMAWSPQEFEVNRELDTQVISVQDLQKSVNDLVDCSHKAIVVLDEPELHSFDLGHSGRQGMKSQIREAGSSVQIPFVSGAVDLEALAETLSQKCNTPLVNADSDEGLTSLLHGPSIIYKKLDAQSPQKSDQQLSKLVSEVRSVFQDNFLILYSSSQTKEFAKKHRLVTRQDPEQPSPSPKKQSGLFHHYTFFSQGIFMGLLVVVIIVPIAFIGISWNLSVQQPQRFEKKQN